MKKLNTNATKAANYIADLIAVGFEINIDCTTNVKKVHVRDPRNGKEEKFAFEVLDARHGFLRIVSIEDAFPETKEKQEQPS